ncbi:MAG: carboxypeptidase-like regulatory domain-containing protein, partial [Bacteroidetes bacterium]
MRIWLLGCFLLGISLSLTAQSEKATVTGIVRDAVSDRAIELVTVYMEGTNRAVETAENGRYSLVIPANEKVSIIYSRIGYQEAKISVGPLPARANQQVDVSLVPIESDLEVIVREGKIEEGGMIKEDVEQLKLLPTTTGNLESVLPHIALGVSSGSGGELSSQYNVRGGNYDENLVYVNDFAIYRPQLIRAGQQEGLTFANIDLIRDLSFSSGGFEARYGDKLSSVLDIKYKRPDSLRASVGMSFLGGSAHLEGSLRPSKDSYRRLRYLVGIRYKDTRYLLGSLDVTGEYTPSFTDIQTYITYDLNNDWQVGLLGNFNQSIYRFRPTQRTTGFGLINLALQLRSVFDGQEVNDFTTQMGGLHLTYIPDRSVNPFFLKFLISAFRSDENERIDITGRYSLGQIDSNLGSDNFGEIVAELGAGTQQQFVRNFLDIQIYNTEHKGGIEYQGGNEEVEASHFIQWSVKAQHERIDDFINEWERLDSAGYSLPYDTTQVLLSTVLKTSNSLRSNRFTAFLQDTYTWRRDETAEIRLSGGVRASYWDLNQELLISPRVQVLYKPLAGKCDISYRLASGFYYQPPFYRELRAFDGRVNTGLLAQKSIHVVGGFTLDFYLGRRNPKKFRFITEAYYKSLWDLVSYEIENVRIRYSGMNDSRGYATGIDFRLNGEFVPGAESWINLSLLRARESLNGVQHLRRERNIEEAVEVDDVPRPSDQLFQL